MAGSMWNGVGQPHRGWMFIVVLLVLCLTIQVEGNANAFVARQRAKAAVKTAGRAEQLLRDGLLEVDQISDHPWTCNHHIHMEWSAQVGSGVFATPRIVDLNNDGRKEILIPTITQYLEAIDGATGEDVPGFPFTHPRFKSYGSPLPVDIDGDGEMEWLLAMYTGELMLFGDDGKARGAIKIPPLPMKKNWLDEKLNVSQAVVWKPKDTDKRMYQADTLAEHLRMRKTMDWTERRHPNAQRLQGSSGVRVDRRSTQVRAMQVQEPMEEQQLQQQQPDASPNDVGNQIWEQDFRPEDEFDMAEDMYDNDFDEEGYFEHGAPIEHHEGNRSIGAHGRLSPEAYDSMRLLWHPELYKSSGNYAMERDVFDFKTLRSAVELEIAEDEILVDPHILSTPVIIDVNGDGDLDIILHTSYFFDADYYSRPEKRATLPSGIDPNNYVASALLCFNLVTGDVKWIEVLQIGTQNDEQPPYGLSSPLVVNPNEDSLLDIFVTSSEGRIFGFSGRGKLLKGWPQFMSPIIASCAGEDVDGDGKVDICVGDILGSMACYTGSGALIWQRQLAGAITERVTFGDVNGDGFIDVVVGTSAGELYALHGQTGANIQHFPFHAGGGLMASPLLVNLNDTVDAGSDGLHVVIPADDGILYVVSGVTGCYELIDIDEKVSASVLADDLTGNGMLDLIVSTLSGTILVFETASPYHPRKAWTSKMKSINGATASEGHVGVHIHPRSRGPFDVRGDTFKLTFVIEDQRKSAHAAPKQKEPVYSINIFVGTRVLVHRKNYFSPGVHTVTLRAPLERMYASVNVVMTLSNGQMYQDSIALSFNMRFLETIKYSLIGPFVLVVLALAFVKKKHEVPLEDYERFERYHH